jgi:VWFA-related protein
MSKPAIPILLLVAYAFLISLLSAQKVQRPTYKVDVEMVVLTFSVTDGKGRSITGLRPADVRISEDGIPQQIVSFAEGSEAALRSGDSAPAAGTSVFILFDTSNHMYRMFPYVYDSIAEFVRRLDPADPVAIYTFSRNLSRAARLTSDHIQARAGLRNAVAGDDTALFNAILLTLRDAALEQGRKAIVVFSNGRDNTSMVSPDDVSRVAENEGIPVYVISTQDESTDRDLTSALKSLTARTGGKLYAGRDRQSQASAFASVRQEIHSSYTACYYPAANPNGGFRSIKVEFADPDGKGWHVRTRAGYDAHKGGRQGLE